VCSSDLVNSYYLRHCVVEGFSTPQLTAQCL